MDENISPQKGEGSEEKNPPEPQRPKHIFKRNQNLDPSRSKSAPAEDFNNDIDESEDCLSSYNYYIYYNSLKPHDPRMPKPTYKPKPNLDFIKDIKDKIDEEEEENQEQGNDSNKLNQLDNLTNEINNLNLDSINTLTKNPDLANDNNLIMNNISQNQNKNNKALFNQNSNDAPSPFDYYVDSMNMENPQNNMVPQQQQFLNNQNLGMYNPGMVNMGGMPGIFMNNGMNLYGNFPQYGNMTGINPTLMNQGSLQYNRGNKNLIKKDNNINRAQEAYNQMLLQNQMLMYNNQINNFYPFPQQNMMMNMNMNYQNDPRFQMMQMAQEFQRNKMMTGDMNNYDLYQNNNMKNLNKTSAKKGKKGENFVKKEGNEYKNIEDIIERAVELSKDHTCSRLVQRKYEEGGEAIRNKIFEKFKPEIINLSKDIFGNYAIQKVLEFKDDEKNNFIMESFKGKIYELSMHMYGCRVMQQLINVIDEKCLSQIIDELKDHFEKCIEDQNGNHVIQKLIGRLKPGENNDIYKVVYNKIVPLSKHQYGCRVIQTLLKKCNEEQISKILEKIVKNVKELSEDQYGNYIIQYILETQNDKNIDLIYEGLKGNIYDFSIHKYASNVVERALNFGNQKQRQNIINEILKQDEKKECLLSMVKDKFGNYVVQKLIECSDEKSKNIIINRITSNLSSNKKDGFSKHVINFIDKLNQDNNGINTPSYPDNNKDKNKNSKRNK